MVAVNAGRAQANCCIPGCRRDAGGAHGRFPSISLQFFDIQVGVIKYPVSYIDYGVERSGSSSG